METTEQIENTAPAVCPVAVIPAPSLLELPPQPAATETPAQAPAPDLLQPDSTSQDEATLTTEIVQLWQVHQDCQSSIKQETQQFRSLRSELGRLLHQMKALLAKPGRNGQWSGWLKQNRISRATADRLVLRHERSLHPESSCLTESISEPTEEEIKTLLDKIAPNLRRVLKTPASAYKFIQLLSASFEGVERCVTEEAILILNPVQPAQTVVEQSVPEEPEVEPVPVVANVLGEGDVQSSGTAMAL